MTGRGERGRIDEEGREAAWEERSDPGEERIPDMKMITKFYHETVVNGLLECIVIVPISIKGEEQVIKLTKFETMCTSLRHGFIWN